MKKIFLLLGLFSLTTFAQNVTYTTSNLNLRANESETSKVVKVIKSGEKVTLLGYVGQLTTVNGNRGHWVQISYQGKRGYLFDYYLSDEETAAVIKTESKTYMYVAAPSGLRLRQSPSMTAKVLTTIENEKQVEYLESTGIEAEGEEQGYFVKIKYGKLIGYVHNSYLVSTP